MQRVGGVDLALVAVSANFLPSLTAQQALEHMQALQAGCLHAGTS